MVLPLFGVRRKFIPYPFLLNLQDNLLRKVQFINCQQILDFALFVFSSIFVDE